jgi:protocatechuate 3,4-dioxygenase beta subunit
MENDGEYAGKYATHRLVAIPYHALFLHKQMLLQLPTTAQSDNAGLQTSALEVWHCTSRGKFPNRLQFCKESLLSLFKFIVPF